MKVTMMADKATPDPQQDPKGLIREAYRIDGITPSQCRSVFLDCELSLPSGQDTNAVLRDLLDFYGNDAPDHPMSDVMRQGLTQMTNPRRRGGWRSRSRNFAAMH